MRLTPFFLSGGPVFSSAEKIWHPRRPLPNAIRRSTRPPLPYCELTPRERRLCRPPKLSHEASSLCFMQQGGRYDRRSHIANLHPGSGGRVGRRNYHMRRAAFALCSTAVDTTAAPWSVPRTISLDRRVLQRCNPLLKRWMRCEELAHSARYLKSRKSWLLVVATSV